MACGRAHREVVYLSQKQSSNTHPKEECGCRHPLQWGVNQRHVLNHLYRTVLPGLCLPLANYLGLILTPDWTQHTPQYACASLDKDGFQSKGCCNGIRTCYGPAPLPFWPLGVLLHMCNWGALLDRKSNWMVIFLRWKMRPSLKGHRYLLIKQAMQWTSSRRQRQPQGHRPHGSIEKPLSIKNQALTWSRGAGVSPTQSSGPFCWSTNSTCNHISPASASFFPAVLIILSLYSSWAQFLQLTFSLLYQKEIRSNLPSLTSPRYSQSRGPSISYLK